MTTLLNFQFPESHEIIFCWDADVRPKSEIHPFSDFKNFEFPAPQDMVLVLIIAKASLCFQITLEMSCNSRTVYLYDY